jgi:WD40 repeat protein
VTLWDVKSGEPKATLTGPTQPVDSVAFSPDGTLLASDSENPPPGTDPLLWLWDVKSGQAKANLQSQPGAMVGADIIAFSPNGTLLASADGPVHLWDVKHGTLIATLQGSDQNISYGAVAFSPDGSLLAAASTHDVMASGAVQLWDVKSRMLKATLQHGTDPVDGNTVAFSPDGTLLASSGDDGGVRLWGIPTAQLPGTSTVTP